MKMALTPSVRSLGLLSSAFLTLLFLVAMPGCKGDGLSEYQRQENRKEDVLNSLREQGATITTKTYPGFGNGYVIDLKGAQITDQTFQNLKELKRVTELDLSKSSLTDDQMDQLNDGVVFALTKLDLSNTAVTDAGLEKLTHLKMCMYLDLSGTKVTKAAAQRFEKENSKPRSFRNVKLPALKVKI